MWFGLGGGRFYSNFLNYLQFLLARSGVSQSEGGFVFLDLDHDVVYVYKLAPDW